MKIAIKLSRKIYIVTYRGKSNIGIIIYVPCKHVVAIKLFVDVLKVFLTVNKHIVNSYTTSVIAIRYGACICIIRIAIFAFSAYIMSDMYLTSCTEPIGQCC